MQLSNVLYKSPINTKKVKKEYNLALCDYSGEKITINYSIVSFFMYPLKLCSNPEFDVHQQFKGALNLEIIKCSVKIQFNLDDYQNFLIVRTI